MNPNPRMEPTVYRFGSFELIPSMRMLYQNGTPVRVGSRALDLLVTLVESAGTVVTKDELMARVWPDVVVEEANLRVQIFMLRRLLGDDGYDSRYIVHVSRRGYVFVNSRQSARLNDNVELRYAV